MKNSLLADSPITWKITLFERCFIAIWGSEMFLELTVDCEFSFCLHVIKNNWGGWGGGEGNCNTFIYFRAKCCSAKVGNKQVHSISQP